MFSGHHSCSRRPPPPKNFSGELSGQNQKHSPSPDLLDPPHHSPPRAVTAFETTTTAATHPTTPSSSSPHHIYITSITLVSHQMWCIWFHKHQRCTGFVENRKIVQLALGLAQGGVRLGGSHHNRMRLGGSHHQGCVCFDRKHHRVRLGSSNNKRCLFGYSLTDQGALGCCK
nr:hypothetical protein [Tanacetum cinerariifolium]